MNRILHFCIPAIVLVFLSFLAQAQLTDNFSDGDFSDNPEWTGNTGAFIVNSSQQLQLNSSGDGLSYLTTLLPASGLTEWRVWVKLAFSPSDNNNLRIYLASDAATLTDPLNGFFLKLGESGSADAIELYRQSGTATYLICRGTDAYLAAAFTINLRIVRTEAGVWNIYADNTGGDNFGYQASGVEPLWDNYAYFGFLCKYTSSNATKFTMDNVYAGPALFDDIKPILLSAEISGESSLALQFSEAVDAGSASETENYLLDQGIGNPTSAAVDDISPSKVNLGFAQPINPGNVYNLTVSNVTDLAGNQMNSTTVPIAVFDVHPFDIVINEIMADPEPAVGLPAFEYLELFNKSSLAVQLEGWQLKLGSSQKTFPARILAPGAYLIVCSDAAAAAMAAYGDVQSFSSLAIVNTGSTITLRDAAGAVIHNVSYTDSWYADIVKKNGGWSLEQIDASNPCGGQKNWRASIDLTGGTPGRQNSIKGVNTDNSEPGVERVSITGASTIDVFFTEPMDSVSLIQTSSYTINQGMGNPLAIILLPPDYRSVSLLLPGTIEEGILYTISMQAGFTDCAGNSNTMTLEARFALPQNIDTNDVVINEILYDPTATGTDFVEIYNRSDKIIDLRQLWLANRKTPDGPIETVNETCPGGRLMFPGDYLVLTKDPLLVQSCYFTPSPSAFVKMESFPSYPNESGTVVLVTPAAQIIDVVTYSAGMQFALLTSLDGVSLERIFADAPSTSASNWHSAAQNVGFATPGYKNSQAGLTEISDGNVEILPEIFSPDNDGVDDIVNIACTFDEPGTAVTIRIFDSKGLPVRLLVKNEAAGTKGNFVWDGITDSREKAPVGIYIVYVETFDLTGKTNHYKKAVVLATRL